MKFSVVSMEEYFERAHISAWWLPLPAMEGLRDTGEFESERLLFPGCMEFRARFPNEVFRIETSRLDVQILSSRESQSRRRTRMQKFIAIAVGLGTADVIHWTSVRNTTTTKSSESGQRGTARSGTRGAYHPLPAHIKQAAASAICLCELFSARRLSPYSGGG